MDSSIAEIPYVAECADRIDTRRRDNNGPGDVVFHRNRMEWDRDAGFPAIKQRRREVVSDWLVRITVALVFVIAVALVAQHVTGCSLPILDMIGR
jgi:hypothetical protein